VNAEFWLVTSALLFAIGADGVLTKRNVIRMVMALELMVSAVNLNCIVFSVARVQGMVDTAAQVFVIVIIAVEAAVMGFLLALITVLYRRYATLNVDEIRRLRW